MPELFLEFFSEEMPANLQKNARKNLLNLFKENFEKNNITYKENLSFSTPNRLVLYFNGIPKEINQKAFEIKGPKIEAPKEALEGFIKSNNLLKKDIKIKENDKGKFYFGNVKSKKINVSKQFSVIIPELISKLSWKKSMRWSDFNLSWGRPLKSILCLFNNKIVNFKYFHLESSNKTFVNSKMEEANKAFLAASDRETAMKVQLTF